jgi:hypothetical protein
MTDRTSLFGDLISAVAAAFGMPASEFRAVIETIRKKTNVKRTIAVREKEFLIRKSGDHRQLIHDYYSSSDDCGLQQFTIRLSNNLYPSTIFTTSTRVGLSLPLTSLPTNYDSSASQPCYSSKAIAIRNKLAAKVANKLDLLGVQIWDQDLYCLAGDPFEGNTLHLSFSLSQFLRYRFSEGLLEDELLETLITHEGSSAAILKDRMNKLPLRHEILPTLQRLREVNRRISAGGLACVVAMARGAPHNDYCIPLQLRSDSVAEGRGVYTTSIQAWHQPTVGDNQEEVKLYWTVLREMFEEVYGGEEAERTSRRFRHDWYLAKCPGVAYIVKSPEAVTLEFLGIGMNVLLGTYDCAILLAIHDPQYWDTYSHEMTRSWEAKGIKLLSTREAPKLLSTVFSGGWYDQGMFSLSQCLLRLRQLESKRVAPLDLGYELL